MAVIRQPFAASFSGGPPSESLVFMRITEFTAASAVLALTCVTAGAQVTTLTQAGYTGLGITPNAHLIDWGRVEATYDRQLPGVVSNPMGHNYVLGFGLLPNMEIAGRLATNSLGCNAFSDKGCGIRDLSASGKLGIGLDAAHRFSLAAGVTDVGGAATNFRTFYGVLTFDQGPLQASAGIAKRSATNPARSLSPLHGPFASAAWQPLPWIRGQVEYTDGNAWAGVRLFAPKAWLPEGWSAYIGSNHRLTSTNLTRAAWLTAGVSIPLYKVPSLPGSGPKVPLPDLAPNQRPLPAYEARTPPAPAAMAPAGPASTAPEAAAPPAANTTRPVTDSDLERLAAALEAKGLEDISIGRMPDTSIAVRANNGSYRWNSVDALGAALGAIARTLGDNKVAYRLIVTERQVPLVAVTGQSDCLRSWINDPNAACTAGQLSTPGAGALEPLHDGAAWVVTHRKPSWQTVHLSISPVLRTNVGTEVGAFDYSLGANVGLRLPLWAGASIDWRRDVPVANSSNYQANAAFSTRRIRSGTERFALTQTVRVPLEHWLAPGDDVKTMRRGLAAVTAQATVGRVGTSFDGVGGELRWEPGEGRHRLSGQTGYFRNSDFEASTSSFGPRTAKPLLASYRYNLTATRTFLEATGGQFLYNDRGFQLGMRQWFSDVAVSAYYRRTRFQGAPVRQFVGIEFSIPIGPRRDVSLGRHLEVGGTPRFSHSVETLVRGGNNAVRPGFGLPSPAPSLGETFNSDRSGLVYFEDNIRRIRDAAR
jgi:hypothetical protein